MTDNKDNLLNSTYYLHGDGVRNLENMTGNESYYYYYYYYSDNSDTPLFTAEELKRFIPVAIFYIVIFLLGVVGNSLVIYCVAKYKRMKSITNQLLLSLACADLLLTLICVPIKFAKLFSFGWVFGSAMCTITHYAQTWSMVASVMTLTTISLERYYAISRPLRAKYICTTNHARAVILSIWIAASVFSLPTIFVQKHHIMGKTDIHPPIYWCDKLYLDTEFEMLVLGYEIYMLLLLFLLPIIVMATAYGGVCVELWAVTEDTPSRPSLNKHFSNQENKSVDIQTYLKGNTPCTVVDVNSAATTPSKDFNKSHTKEAQVRRQVLKMLITVVVLFIVCWCPILCYNVFVATGAIQPFRPTLFPYAIHMNAAFSLLAYSNSCLNPLVYGFMSRYFRKSFQQALSSCCLTSQGRYAGFYSKACNYHDRSSLSLRKPGEKKHNHTDNADSAKRNTITTVAADSTLSRSPPISPTNTYTRNTDAI